VKLAGRCRSARPTAGLIVVGLCLAAGGLLPASAGAAAPGELWVNQADPTCSDNLTLPENIRGKRLLVQAPMAIPHWCAREHGHFRLRSASAICGRERNLLLLPVKIAFGTRSSLVGFSDNSGLPGMRHVVLVCALSHSTQFAPGRTKALCFNWPAFNLFCQFRMRN